MPAGSSEDARSGGKTLVPMKGLLMLANRVKTCAYPGADVGLSGECG